MIQKVIYMYIVLFLVIAIFFGGRYYSKTEERNFSTLKSNTYTIIKDVQIIENNKNPKGIFQLEENINKNIGTGFFITKNLFITAGHIINKDKKDYRIEKNSIFFGTGILELLDEENDIAILKTKENKYFKNNKYSEKIEDNIIVKSLGLDIEKNIIESIKGKIINIDNKKIYTDIIYKKGYSGGPLVNSKGEIIGMNIEYDLLNKNGISVILNNDTIKKYKKQLIN